MRTKRIIKWVALIFSISICIVAIAFWAIRANAQTQTIDDLKTLLIQKGVPIKSITTVKQIPFIIKISIQSKSNDKNLLPEDLYFAQLVRKAASLFYRQGQRIDSYELEIVNSDDVSISWESNNMLPGEFSQQNSLRSPSKFNDIETASIVQNNLNLYGLVIDTINVSSDSFLGDYGKELTFQLSTTDINSANQDLIPFLLSLHDALDEINNEYGTNITICWLRVFDNKGNQILNYVWDLETREETSIQVPGLRAWYPVPLPVPTTTNTPSITPIASSTPTPNNGTQSYPPPSIPITTIVPPIEPLPTNQPYP
ncbi:MAG: hypothetical protein WAV05_04480 [Anaerolineales bacterium]